MKKEEIVTALAVNTRFTALELNDLLEVLGAVIQHALKTRTEVILPGVGELKADEAGKIGFIPAPELEQIVANPTQSVQVKNLMGLTNTDLWTGGRWVFKHNVNVC
jgi:nucleoid DNA-binding protein